jgi:predicted aspartyl protease
MGRVTVEAVVENSGDLWNASEGTLPADKVRRAVIPSALIDTGATLLSLPTSLIRQLGLKPVTTKRVTASTGQTEATLYSTVRLTVMDRFCTMDVLEVPDGVPPLIGVIPLEHLDFVVDPKGQRLIGNPEHGGEHVYEMY